MRTILTAGLLALVTALAPLPVGIAAADDHTGRGGLFGRQPSPAPPTLPEQASPRAVLATAQRVLDGDATSTDPSPTLALRDLRVALPSLRGEDAREAEALLARPSDGAQDPYGDGYTVNSRRVCGTHVCVHWVPRTGDAPPSRAWVDRTKEEVNRVHRRLVNGLGYRKPLGDGRRGGNGKLDVYLKDIGDQGYYGYCAAERTHPTYRRTASGYCVLDDDYAEFNGTRLGNMRVTAAHELFHAVQYAYDFREDAWLMEATSTWVEERLADKVNDNRQYLTAGQYGRPRVPLDRFNSGGVGQYGNWIWWEYLSQRFGNDIVKQVWRKVGAYRGAPNQYSVQAMKAQLAGRGGLTAVYTRFGNDNLRPQRTYAEGGAYETSNQAIVVRSDARSDSTSVDLDHLTSSSAELKPGGSLESDAWRLKLVVNAPALVTGPGAHVAVTRTSGTIVRYPVTLTDQGYGKVVVPFSSGSVSNVAVTLANASARYRCRRGTAYACAGTSRDDNRTYGLRYTAYQQ